MDTYSEGLIAVFICLTVLNAAVIGIGLYYVFERTKKDRNDTIKLRVLVESLIEIFTHGDKEEDEKSSGK